MLDVGSRAPSFELPDFDGNSRSLREILTAGPVLLAFFKASCPTCQFTFPFLERIHNALGQSTVHLFAISQDDQDETLGFHQEFGITFPTLLDSAGSGYPASNGFGISHVPSLFLIEPDGMISWALEGFHKKELESLAERLGISIFRSHEYVPEWKAG